MKILVTGKDGFLGKNLKDFVAKGDKNTWVFIGRNDYDLVDSKAVAELYSVHKPDTVVHLAGMASARNNDSSFIDANIKGTYNLLTLAPKQIDFVFASSVLVYGDNNSCTHEFDKLTPNSPYAISKVTCEQLLTLFYKLGKIRPRILRFCGIVGPYMKHGRIYSILNGERNINMFGRKPGNYCPMITSETACKVIVKATKSNKAKILCNVTPAQDTISIEQVFDILQKELDITLNINWNNDNSPSEYICCHNSMLRYELDVDITESSRDALKHGLKLYLRNEHQTLTTV